MSEETKAGSGLSAELGPLTVPCPDCGEPMSHRGTSMTLVGYYSPPGHDHDDNCRTRIYTCPNGHSMGVSRQNSCPVCDWKGKSICFCHPGEKVSHWPEERA